jgi:hypothetical protein
MSDQGMRPPTGPGLLRSNRSGSSQVLVMHACLTAKVDLIGGKKQGAFLLSCKASLEGA